MVIMMVLVASSVVAVDILRFSGSISGGSSGGNGTLIGNVTSCGNDVCQPQFGEDYLNCYIDCTLEPFLNITLIDSFTDGLSTNQYSDGWNFTFELSYFHPDAEYIEFMIDDFVGGSHILETEGNVIMEYVNASGIKKTYNVMNTFNEPASDFVDTFLDESSDDGTQATVVIKVKLPVETYPTQYSADYTVGIFEI